MNKLSIGKITVDYAKTKVSISDIFIDGCSLQELLKSTFTNNFAVGRFKEFFMPILGLNFSDKIDFGQDRFSSLIPNNNETLITPLYGCHDNCCVYLFLEISNKNNTIVWENIGRNSNFIFDKEVVKNDVDWLPNFEKLYFDIENYKTVINKLK
jgi:hypothetical protein